jgi:putative effector of murein hydrolase LrgA (UPF0299 family)
MLKRLTFLSAGLFFVPAGYFVVKSAFYLNSPHIFVMSIFSGSLMILLGLTGFAGLVMSFEKKSEDDKD